MFYTQSENDHNSRFVDRNISEIHELLQSDCNIINVHLEKYYNFDSDKKYKYYNPNLIRNNGLISKNQQIHCNFLSSICKSIKLLDISIFSFDNGSTYSVIQL